MIKKYKNQGFTLVEILIVVALIAILAVIALITINPAEANKKARDTQRLKEMGTLQGIIQQYIDDNIETVAASTADSSMGTPAGSTDCHATAGWHGLELCPYANTIPKDPFNRTGEYTDSTGTKQADGAINYQIVIDDNARYRICTHLESTSNAKKLTQDNGEHANLFEIWSSEDSPDCTLAGAD